MIIAIAGRHPGRYIYHYNILIFKGLYEKSIFWGVAVTALSILGSCKSNQVLSSSRGPVVGSVPCIERKFVEDREALKEKMEKKAKSSLTNSNVGEESYVRHKELEEAFNQAMIEEEKRLVGTTIGCTTIPTETDENGNDVFDFFVDNVTATFTAHEYGSFTSYVYACDLIAQRDVPWRGSTMVFDVFFTDDDFQELYGTLVQILSLEKPRVQKGDRVPCSFSIRNINTDDPEELQKKCTHVLLRFRP